MGAPQLQYAIPAGGGVPVGVAGAGTVNRLTKWTAATTVGDSGVSDDGSTVTFNARNLAINTGLSTFRTVANPNSYTIVAQDDIAVFTGTDATGTTSLRLGSSTSLPQGCAAVKGKKTVGGGSGTMTFQTATGGVLADKMTIDETGNVGIGTTSPASPMHVFGASTSAVTTASAGIFRIEGSATNKLFFGSFSSSPFGLYAQTNDVSYPLALQPAGGNVGIGTASPAAPLHVNGNQIGGTGASATPYQQTLFGSSSSYTMWWKTGGTAGGGIVGAAGPSLWFYVASGLSSAPTLTPVATFDATGNFGIGTASPVSKLDVAGTITCDDAATGIKLPAAPGNADVQTLDAYLETLLTVGLLSTGGTVTLSTSSNYNKISITRIGNCVYGSGYLKAASVSSPTGRLSMVLTGMPQPVTVFQCTANVMNTNAIPAGSTWSVGSDTANPPTLYLDRYDGTSQLLDMAPYIKANTVIGISFVYQAL